MKAALFSFAGMDDDGLGRRKDLQESEMKRGMKCVERTKETICNYMNPFDSFEDDSLICLSSGTQVPHDVAKKMIDIDKCGLTYYENFIKERLFLKKTSLHAPIKKTKLKTFGSLKKAVSIGKN